MKHTDSTKDSKAGAARRKEQNRIAQAKRRNGKEQLIKDLQDKVVQLSQALRSKNELSKELYRSLHQILSVNRLHVQDGSSHHSVFKSDTLYSATVSPESNFTDSTLSESVGSESDYRSYPINSQHALQWSQGLQLYSESSTHGLGECLQESKLKQRDSLTSIEQVMAELIFDPMVTRRLSHEDVQQGTSLSGCEKSSVNSNCVSVSSNNPYVLDSAVNQNESKISALTLPQQSWINDEITMEDFEQLRKSVQCYCDGMQSANNFNKELGEGMPEHLDYNAANFSSKSSLNDDKDLYLGGINMQDWKFNLPHSF
ncbi:uncharacterized protein FA14DRAFT_162537 [Meira miltonrushii]|uniref:BZIP domain-containing protein n=1 Tax=Meira miltonrushii TaxID=1280837 RepID=A0A316V1W0_9BASI|nr:uncharacterized protein FA14DRAFT_162537 [Meira miltonrushii]PWN31526.1 hypothetical protein FA14DRAFT_162537 [Meira miltonrushii]